MENSCRRGESSFDGSCVGQFPTVLILLQMHVPMSAIGESVVSEMRCAKCHRPLIESSPVDGVLLLCQGCNAEEAHCTCTPLSKS